MNTGDVLYFSDFKFRDGGHADKLLVVISDCSKDALVMIITTSKGKDANAHGCQPTPKKFFIKGGKHGFPKDTWIDLARPVFVFPKESITSALESGKAEVKMTLSEPVVNEIRNCLVKHALDSLSREGCEILSVKPKW